MLRRLQNAEAARLYRLRRNTRETEEEAAIRRFRDAERMRRKRSEETQEETALRRFRDAERMRRKRSEETEEEAAIRRSQNAERMRQYRMRKNNRNRMQNVSRDLQETTENDCGQVNLQCQYCTALDPAREISANG